MWRSGATVSVELGVDQDNRTLMQKWRDHVEKKKEQGHHVVSAARFMRILFLFQAPTQLYMFLNHIIPTLFAENDEWTQYYVKVLACHVFLQAMANWLCAILYDPSVQNTEDRPFLALSDRWENPPDMFIPLIKNDESSNGVIPNSAKLDTEEQNPLSWTRCDKCDLNIPPRAHHCNVCQKCILKRDHHCYMIGNCIGFKNQRFFTVLTFYTAIAGCFGGYYTYYYIQSACWTETSSWTDLIPPVAIVRGLFGSLELRCVLAVIHIYLEMLFGFIGFIYLLSQLSIIIEGKTLYELAKRIPVRSTTTINQNFRSVFGDFWALNFIFPMHIVLRQREDGMVWEGVKIDHNANQETKIRKL